MGEPISVIEKPSGRTGYVRFETNRSFTGMGHESFTGDEIIYGDRPVDELARSLFTSGKVDEVHIYAQMITVKLAQGSSPLGLKKMVEDHFIYYRPGVEVPSPESFNE